MQEISRTLHTLQSRPNRSNKYDFGHVLVVGGASGMIGAPLLAAEAALRVGAGLVSVASGASVIDKLERRVREVMTLRLAGDTNKSIGILLEFIQKRRVTVLVVGPGLAADQAALVRELSRHIMLPIVLDGGGLAAFNGHLADLHKVTQKNTALVLTPHEGEFARLAKVSPTHNDISRQKAAASFANEYNLTVVLKGAASVVAAPGHQIYVNTSGNPGLATAGTGDVLAGILGGLLAQHIPPVMAAKTGVFVHGLAADIAIQTKTQAGLIASDVIEALPRALTAASGE